jgi:hypothetical protein
MPVGVMGDDGRLVHAVELIGRDVNDEPVLLQPCMRAEVTYPFSGYVLPLAVPGLMQVLAEKDRRVTTRAAGKVPERVDVITRAPDDRVPEPGRSQAWLMIHASSMHAGPPREGHVPGWQGDVMDPRTAESDVPRDQLVAGDRPPASRPGGQDSATATGTHKSVHANRLCMARWSTGLVSEVPGSGCSVAWRQLRAAARPRQYLLP